MFKQDYIGVSLRFALWRGGGYPRVSLWYPDISVANIKNLRYEIKIFFMIFFAFEKLSRKNTPVRRQ
jgi:hypothetical protein